MHVGPLLPVAAAGPWVSSLAYDAIGKVPPVWPPPPLTCIFFFFSMRRCDALGGDGVSLYEVGEIVKPNQRSR